MTSPSKRNSSRVAAALDGVAAADDQDRIASLSREELERELRAEGIDLADITSEGRAVVDRRPASVAGKAGAMRWPGWVAIALFAALIVALLVRWRIH